ncbi:2',5'-phosphodiesterase 12 [Parasteatoda tepidariorum]|uniref:2',5'-phosphodiesterase 12 n=1 Tax=Parasteatoda tepidariorum TaxID=114398 RepID=UPI0039BD7CBB
MNLRSKAFKLMLNVLRYNSSHSRNLPIVKVLCLDDDSNIKVSFKMPRSSYLNVKAPKEESCQSLLSRIKLMVNLQRKKEEMRQVVMNKYSNVQVAVEEAEEDFDVNLIQNNTFMDEKTLNMEAWAQATQLKIGELSFDVKFNFPSVISLNLPEYILSGCSIRPRFRLECANLEDCCFIWYRSQSKDKFNDLLNIHGSGDLIIEEDRIWLKVSEGFIYTTCSDDIGCFLKVVCIPRRGKYVGQDYSTASVGEVQAVPEKLPFEKRQKFTPNLTEDDSIRCVSYNTLANTYVEKRKFPYCSEKARNNYYRKQLLLKELIGYNSDIICLQEVEERLFSYDIFPVLERVGFHGGYKKKGGRRYEGLASFYRTSKFKLIKSYEVLLNEIIYKDFCKDLRTKVSGSNRDVSVLLKQDSAFQILVLQLRKFPFSMVIVANTHLYSNKDSPEVRLIQAALCTQYIENLIKTEDLKSAGVLFCGDFNSMPNSETYNFMTSGKCFPSWKNNSNMNEEAPLTHGLNLDSACGTPDYTNYTEEFYGCLDYIFYSKNKLTVSEVVPMPRHEDVIAQIGLPNEYFPSDHLALVCTLKWNNL